MRAGLAREEHESSWVDLLPILVVRQKSLVPPLTTNKVWRSHHHVLHCPVNRGTTTQLNQRCSRPPETSQFPNEAMEPVFRAPLAASSWRKAVAGVLWNWNYFQHLSQVCIYYCNIKYYRYTFFVFFLQLPSSSFANGKKHSPWPFRHV